jgi:MFS family permease
MADSKRYTALAVIASTLAVAYGIWYAYSVILVALLAEFGWSRSMVAGAFSLFTLVHGAASPLMGALCARFKPLQLFVLFGLLTAFSVAAGGWVPALVHVQREYQDRLGLSIGIISAGVGLGMMLLVPLTQLVIDQWGWRAAFRVLGAISVLWIVPCAFWLMKQQNQKSGSDPDKAEPRKVGVRPQSMTTLREALRMQPLWLLIAGAFFGNLCSQMLHVHQVAFLVDHGLSALVAATVVGAVGLASIVGKTGGGWLSDRVAREAVFVAGVVIMSASALFLLVIGAGAEAPSRWSAYLYAAMLGVGYSVTAAIIPAMVSDRFSGVHYGSIVGMALLGSATGGAIGPLVAGSLYDATGSYTLAFILGAASGLVAAGAGWRAWILRRRIRRQAS